MPKRSPGPEWAVLQEPTPSSQDDSEDELESEAPEDDVISSSLKRKGSNKFYNTTSKRVKLTPQRDVRAGEGSRSSPGPGSDSNSRGSAGGISIAHSRHSTINQNAAAGPSKPSFGQTMQSQSSAASKPIRDFNTTSDLRLNKKASLPNLSVGTSSSSIPPSKSRSKYSSMRRTVNDDGVPGDDSASSPPASASPPDTPMLPAQKFKDIPKPSRLSSLFQDRMHRPFSTGSSNLRSSPLTTQKTKLKPKARASMPSDVIEISSSDSDAPKPVRKIKPKKSKEIIEISSDDDPPAVRNRGKSKSTSKSARESKTPSMKPPKGDDGPPSTLRINPRKSKSGPAPKARHSISGRVEGLKIEDEGITIIYDSDDGVQNSKATASVRAPPRPTRFQRSASSPTMNYGDNDQVMRDPSPDPVPRPKPWPQTVAGNSASTSNSKAAVTSTPKVDKPVQHVAKSSDPHRQAISATTAAHGNNSNPTTNGKATADSSKSAASSVPVSSVKLTSNSLNRDVPSVKAKVDAPVVQDSVAGFRGTTSGTPYAPTGNIRRNKNAIPAAMGFVFAKTVTQATVPAKDLDAMNVDRNAMASTSRSVPSSSRPGDTSNASAKTPDAKANANSSTTSSTQTRSDPGMQVMGHVIPTAAVSSGPTQPLHAASNSSRLGKNSDPPVQATSMLMDKQQPPSSVPASKMHDSSSQPKRERIPAVRQLSGMDMRVLKDVLPKDVPLDSAEKVTSRAGSSLAPVKSVPAASASTSVSVSRVSLAPGASPFVEPPSEAPVSATRPQIPAVPMSTTAVAKTSVPAPAIRRLSTAADTAPVSHSRSEPPNVPVDLPREYVPNLSSPFFRQSSASSSKSEKLPASQLGATSLPTKRKPSMSYALSDPTVDKPVSVPSSVSSHTQTDSASSSQPLADIVTRATQSNTLPPQSNGTPRHNDLRRDNGDSDVEMDSLDQSTYEDAIASAALLQQMIQPAFAKVNSSSAIDGMPSSSESRSNVATPVLPLPRRSIASPEKSFKADAARPPVDVPSLSEPRSVATTSSVPLPRRSPTSPKKTVLESRSLSKEPALSKDTHPPDGARTLTSTSESVALAISSSQPSRLSAKPSHGSLQAQQQKPISTSESVAQAISSSQSSVASSKSPNSIRAGSDSSMAGAPNEKVAHAVSSRQSSSQPASEKRAQHQPVVASIGPSSTSENVARAISSSQSSAPTEQTRSRPPPLSNSVSSQSTRTQTDEQVFSRPSEEMSSRRIDLKLVTGLSGSGKAPSPFPRRRSRLLKNAADSSSVWEILFPTSSHGSTPPSGSQTATTDQQSDKPISSANVPPVRSFTSSTLILTPAQLTSRKAAALESLGSSFTVSKRHVSAPTLDIATSFAMAVDQVTNDISSMGEECDHHPEHISDPNCELTTKASHSHSDSEVEEGLFVANMLLSPKVSPPPVVSSVPTPPAVHAATKNVSTSPASPEIPEGGTSIDDVLEGRRRSSRLSSQPSSSRSSSADPLGVVPYDDDEFNTPESPPPSHSRTPDDIPGPVTLQMYGGYPSLNWQTFRQDIRNFTPKCYWAKDLPHTLQDNINRWPESARLHPQMRHVLQSAILENTADDEPDAPYIEIVNNVDHEPTPPWEFHYSNKMWHTDGVPPPDVTRLTSCGCMGKCDPKSKTCACIKRQQQYTSDVYPDFAYDKNGRLRLFGYPIFECNDLCGCDDECRNRVVQHGRTVGINICKTKDKGWGVFAGSRKIPSGTFIGIYAGELLTDDVGEERGKKYNLFGRTYLFDLDFYYLKDNKEDWEVKYVVDAYHTGNFTRFLNHSCDPNCQLVPCYINESNIDKPLLAVFSRRDIEAGDELCFSYSGDYGDGDDNDNSSPPAEAGPEKKSDEVYATCRCGAKKCTGKVFA